MASKKCPKCSEDNPAEAVMCWACYTPLSGSPLAGGPAASVAGRTPGGQSPAGGLTADESETKKGVDPKLIAILAFLLVGGGVAFLVNSSMSKPPEDGPIAPRKDPETPDQPFQPNTPSQSPPLSIPSGPNTSTPPAEVPVPFTVVTSPNPKYPTGTMGILVPPTMGVVQIAGVAKFAKNQYTRNGKWGRMQIFAFSDKTSAEAWKRFQEPRRGAPMDRDDYQALATQGLWASTPVFLETSGKKEVVHYPSRNSTSWWAR